MIRNAEPRLQVQWESATSQFLRRLNSIFLDELKVQFFFEPELVTGPSPKPTLLTILLNKAGLV